MFLRVISKLALASICFSFVFTQPAAAEESIPNFPCDKYSKISEYLSEKAVGGVEIHVYPSENDKLVFVFFRSKETNEWVVVSKDVDGMACYQASGNQPLKGESL